MKIKAKIANQTRSSEIIMPMSQEKLNEQLIKIGCAKSTKNEPCEILEIYSDLEFLNESLQLAKDIEEINYMANLVYELYSEQLETYENIISQMISPFVYSVKDLVDITFFVQNCQFVKTNGADEMPPKVPEDLKESSIVTYDGYYIYEGPAPDYKNIYDGTHFAEYSDDSEYEFAVHISHPLAPVMNKNEPPSHVILMPTSETAIDRALDRIGCTEDDVLLTYTESKYLSAINDHIEWEDNIYKVNELAEVMYGITTEKSEAFEDGLCTGSFNSVDDIIKFASFFSYRKVPQPFQKEKSIFQEHHQIGDALQSHIYKLVGITNFMLSKMMELDGKATASFNLEEMYVNLPYDSSLEFENEICNTVMDMIQECGDFSIEQVDGFIIVEDLNILENNYSYIREKPLTVSLDMPQMEPVQQHKNNDFPTM